MKYKNIELDGLDIEIDIKLAKVFIDHRLIMKKPLTQFAFDRQMGIALKGFTINMTPNKVLEYICGETTWQGINLDYIANNIRKSFDAKQEAVSQNTRDVSTEEGLTDRSWANNGKLLN